jgi:hypothetical protein
MHRSLDRSRCLEEAPAAISDLISRSGVDTAAAEIAARQVKRGPKEA